MARGDQTLQQHARFAQLAMGRQQLLPNCLLYTH
jgi:hypothetical protein